MSGKGYICTCAAPLGPHKLSCLAQNVATAAQRAPGGGLPLLDFKTLAREAVASFDAEPDVDTCRMACAMIARAIAEVLFGRERIAKNGAASIVEIDAAMPRYPTELDHVLQLAPGTIARIAGHMSCGHKVETTSGAEEEARRG